MVTDDKRPADKLLPGFKLDIVAECGTCSRDCKEELDFPKCGAGTTCERPEDCASGVCGPNSSRAVAARNRRRLVSVSRRSPTPVLPT